MMAFAGATYLSVKFKIATDTPFMSPAPKVQVGTHIRVEDNMLMSPGLLICQRTSSSSCLNIRNLLGHYTHTCDVPTVHISICGISVTCKSCVTTLPRQ